MTENVLGRHSGVRVHPDFVVVNDVIVPSMGTVRAPVATEFLGSRSQDPNVFTTVNTRSRAALSGGEVPDEAKSAVQHVLGRTVPRPQVQIPIHNHGAGNLHIPEGTGVGYRVDYDKNALVTGHELVRRINDGLIVPGERWRWLTRGGNSRDISDRVGVIVEFDAEKGRTRYKDAEIPDGPQSGFRGRIDDILAPVDPEGVPTGYVVYPSKGDFVLTDTVGYIPRSYLLPPGERLANGVHANSRHLHASRDVWPILFEIKTLALPSKELGMVFYAANGNAE